MKKLLPLLLIFTNALVYAQTPLEKYEIDSASVEHPGVPKGELIKVVFNKSKIFPGTSREYWIYVPSQYSPEKPACVYVNQDGIQMKAPTVFDNLIYKNEMPVTIGIFIMPGRVPAPDSAVSLDRVNRSFEYDGLGAAYGRFILEEILPDAETQKTLDGKPIRLSKNGNDRGIGGASSGAIAAFSVAWEYPNSFSRVFSSIGTYVGFRGGERYPTLIRKFEPKPLRIFLQDGATDLNIYAGDWFKSNEMMERALVFSGYEVRHVWGEGGHNGKQATSIFPDAMRWLWKDWPQPVTVGNTKNECLNNILQPGENWELVGEGYQFTEGLTSNKDGEVFFQDIPNSKTYKIGIDGKLSTLPIDPKKASGTAFGADGTMYVVAGGSKQILSFDKNYKVKVVADSISGNDLAVANNGNIYVTAPKGTENPSEIYLIRPNGEKLVVDRGLKFANGIVLTPDQTQLYITESASHWVWIYSILPDGTLTNKQRYGWLHTPDDRDNAWPDGIKCDSEGTLYVATNMGIQVLDQIGRVNAILKVPFGNVSNCCFGGTDLSMFYITCGQKVYRRKLKVKGVNSFNPPYKIKNPKV
jgi:gluconolactonase